VKYYSSAIAAAAVAALLGGCAGGGSNGGAVPPTTQANLNNDKLQLAVGTAYNAADGSTGLNFVATFRQPSGLSATEENTPSITGPAGFTVPSGFPGAYGNINHDDGTNTISSSPQVAVNQAATDTTLGDFTGVFSYGLAPLNSDNVSAVYVPGAPNAYPGNGFESSNYAGNPFFPEPFGAVAANQGIFLEGPPLVPFFNDGTYPAGFAGYSPGFTAFEIPPVTGTYTMNVLVPISNAASPTFTATGTLASAAVLPAPVISAVSGTGGALTGTVTAGAGTVETLVFATDYKVNSSTGTISAAYYYTAEVTGTGAQIWTIPGTLGPCSSPGCENSASTQAPTFATGDEYSVQAISFDYNAYEAGPPTNTAQTPTIVGANGQADLAIGLSYPSAGPATYAKHRLAVYGKNP
jgi:hypothetical protein